MRNDRFSPRFACLALVLSALAAGCGDPVAVTKPLPPSSLAAAALSSSSIALSWTDLSSGKASFRVERSLSASSGFALVASPEAGSASWTDAGLEASTRYYYRMAAVLGTLVSGYCPVADAATPAAGGGSATTLPAKASNLAALALGPDSVRLTWTDNADNESGYDVVRIGNPSDPGSVVILTDHSTNALPAGTDSYTDTGLLPATEYFYAVSPYNAKGSADFCDPVSVVTSSVSTLGAPADLLVSRGTFGGMMYVDWPSVSGAQNYRLYEGTASDSAFLLLGSPTTTYAWINSVTPGSHFFFKLSAVDYAGNETGRSSWAEGWAGTDCFAEGFEGSRLQSYWDQRIASPEASYAIESPGADGTATCVKIFGGDGVYRPGFYADLNANPTPSSIGFRVRVSALPTASDVAGFLTYASRADQSSQIIYFLVDQLGKLCVRDKDEYKRGNVTCVANTWYAVEFRNIDWSSRTYDFYVDGTLAAGAVTFYWLGLSVGSIDFFVKGLNTDVWWDEIFVR